MLKSLLVILLAFPGSGADPATRARNYYNEGMKQMRQERFADALKSFEMASSLAHHARFEHDLQGETLRMASTSALRAQQGSKAVELAKSFRDWAQDHGAPLDRARARVDLVEAYLLYGNRDAADRAMDDARRAVDAASDPEQRGRLERLEGGGAARSASAPARPAPTGPAIKRQTIQSIDTSEDVAVDDATAIPDRDALLGDMALIPAGTFRMGQVDGETDERPVRDVTVRAFYLDRHEVSNGQFEQFVTATGHRVQGDWRAYAAPGDEQMPARGVTWNDAEAFARWAGKRLPTEAEWERAARGPDGSTYSFGDDYALTAARTGMPESVGPAPVESYPPSPWGLYEMTGNVLEWVADLYAADAYSKPYRGNELGPSRGALRVVRGGAWNADRDSARVANRYASPADQSSPRIGFRCARDAR